MPDDPRIRAFLEEAASCVAAGQGLSPTVRQRLGVLAAQLRLTEEEWTACLEQLASGTRTDPSPARYELAFLELARKAIGPLAGGILSLGREGRLLRAAATRHQLSLIRAHQLLETVCGEFDVRRISRSDAEAAFQNLAADLIGSRRRVPPELVAQLVEAGRAWGIREQDARATIASIERRNVTRLRTAIRRIATNLLALGLAGLLAWQWWTGRWIRSSPEPAGGNSVEAPPATPRPWWEHAALPELETPGLADQIRTALRSPVADDNSQRTACCARIADLALTGSVRDAGLIGRWLEAARAAAPDNESSRPWLESWRAGKARLPGLFPAAPEVLRQRLKIAELAAAAVAARPPAPSEADQEPTPAYERPLTASSLVADWWQQACSLPWPEQGLTPADLLALRQVSQGWMDPAGIASCHARAVRRMLLAGGDVPAGLDRETGIAVESTGTDPAWLETWSQLPTGPARSMLADVLVRKLRGDAGAVSGSQAEQELLSLWRKSGQRPAPENSRAAAAEQSAVVARLWFQERGGDPLTVAVIAQAVNDGLACLREPAAGAELRDVWRFDPGSDGEVEREQAAAALAARATASDLRTLGEVLAEISRWQSEPERAAYRAEALQRLLRIAPRMTELPATAAAPLAGYYLGEHDLEEWLAAEKCLPAFRFWPAFLIAVSDGMRESRISADQALSIAQLCADPGLALTAGDRWRETCAGAIQRAARRLLQEQLSSAAEQDRIRWAGTSRVLGRIGLARRELLGLPAWTASGSAGEIARSNALEFAGRAGEVAGESRGDLADAIWGETVLARELAARWESECYSGEQAARIRQIREQLGRDSAGGTSAGRQLLEVEFRLLELVTARLDSDCGKVQNR